MALHLSSSAFEHRGEIPRKYTADGADQVPPLVIEGVPRNAKSLALVVEDPDAPRAKPFTHWVVYDIPANAQRVGPALPTGASEGINDFGRAGWAGPKPPSGRHRYVFKLYALDASLSRHGALTKEDLERKMKGHILEQAELVGTYARAA